jgi:rare lipoprotein A
MPHRYALAALASLCLFAWMVPAVAAEHCIASHYGIGDGYGGRKTANGERMNVRALTAAHRSLPFGTRVRVCHARSRGGRCVIVRINDRGPYVRGRCIDLSPAAARAIGIAGIGPVIVERVR